MPPDKNSNNIAKLFLMHFWRKSLCFNIVVHSFVSSAFGFYVNAIAVFYYSIEDTFHLCWFLIPGP